MYVTIKCIIELDQEIDFNMKNVNKQSASFECGNSLEYGKYIDLKCLL